MRTPILAASIFVFTLVGCGDKGGAGSASSSASGKASSTGPRSVVVDAASISVAGAKVGPAPGDKLETVSGLLDALGKIPRGTKAPETMGEAASQEPLDVSFAADVSCQAAMSVLFTAERVGFRTIALAVGDRRETIQLAQKNADVGANPNVLALAFRAGGKVAVGRTACAGAFDVQPPASIAASAKELTTGAKITGGPVLVSCEAGTKFADVVDVFVKTRPSDTSALAGMRCEGRTSVPFLALDTPNDPPAPTAAWGRDENLGRAPSFKMGDASKLGDDSVRRGALTVTGALTEADVLAAVEKRMPDVRACYAGALETNALLEGRVVAGLEIGKSGEIMSIENAGSTLPDNRVVACILHQIEQATFTAADKVTRVNFPIAFAPPEKKK